MLGVLLLLSIAAAEFPRLVAAVGTLDPHGQHLGVQSDAMFLDADLSLAQTFTPGLSGGPNAIALSIGKDPSGAPTDPLVIQLESTVGGLPPRPVLASTSLQAGDINGTVPDYSLAVATFAVPPVVAAGTQYAIVLTTRNVVPSYSLAATSEPDSGGQLLIENGAGAGWSNLDGTGFVGSGLVFQTFVTRSPGSGPWPIRYTDFGAYSLCAFDDGTRELCPDQQHVYVACYLSDERTVRCPDGDVRGQ